MRESRTVEFKERLSGFGKTKSQEVLKRLVESGYARVIGNGRGTKYTTA